VDYIGSKLRLLDWIFDHLQRHLSRLKMSPATSLFWDGCSGTGVVSIRACQLGFPVVSSDIMAFPQHLVQGQVGLTQEQFQEAGRLIDEANCLPDVQGFFWHNYTAEGGRQYFTPANALRIDAHRQFIAQVVDPLIQSYLYTALIEAVSRVSNTAGTHGAFLKEYKSRSFDPIFLRKESVCPGTVRALQGDALKLAGTLGEDILYLDPPYTTRQYAPNYHLYETLVQKEDPVIKGVTGLPQNYLRSDFCKGVPEVGDLVAHLLQATRARLVLISYSSDGTLPLDAMLTSMMRGFAHQSVEVQVLAQSRYRSAAGETPDVSLSQEYLREYLFIIEREDAGVLDLFRSEVPRPA